MTSSASSATSARAGAASLGGAITSFPRLFEEVAGGHAAPTAARACSRTQRLALVRAATAARRRCAGSAARRREPGFAPALEALIAELQAAGSIATALA